jgi:hypothetical protein
VKKVEIKGGGGREVERGPSALNYNPTTGGNFDEFKIGRAA